MKDVKITEVKSGKGKIAIFNYKGSDYPVLPLDTAISLYTQGHKYEEFIDMNMNNPWVRIIFSNIDDIMEGAVDFNDIVRDLRLSLILA